MPIVIKQQQPIPKKNQYPEMDCYPLMETLRMIQPFNPETMVGDCIDLEFQADSTVRLAAQKIGCKVLIRRMTVSQIRVWKCPPLWNQ